MAAIAQLIATGIFFSFIYNFFAAVGDVSKIVIPDGSESVLSWFFGHSFNWILVIIASFCYGLAKEMNDISTYGYILSHASPSEYGKILARNNITYGFGSLAGLILSGIILSVNPTFAVFTLAIIIVGFLTFTRRFFDNADTSIEAQDIVSFTVAVKRMNKENVGEYLTEKIQAVDLPKIIENAKYIFLKPHQKKESKMSWTELAVESKKTAKTIYEIMTSLPIHLILYWTMSLVLIFWFWDTFASTFLIDYLDGKKPGWSYVMLAIIALPALGLQEIAGSLAGKIGVKTVAYIGLALSWVSLIAMGIFSGGWLGVILICALINSLGYACGMSLGQNEFLDSYNHIYAEKMGLTEIDANASAGPMKILQNLANVIGLILWGFILGILGYAGFFIIFGCIILAVLAWSISRRREIEV
jgi:MFS family permease